MNLIEVMLGIGFVIMFIRFHKELNRDIFKK
jgi:hypothetical protein